MPSCARLTGWVSKSGKNGSIRFMTWADIIPPWSTTKCMTAEPLSLLPAYPTAGKSPARAACWERASAIALPATGNCTGASGSPWSARIRAWRRKLSFWRALLQKCSSAPVIRTAASAGTTYGTLWAIPRKSWERIAPRASPVAGRRWRRTGFSACALAWPRRRCCRD